MHLNRMDSVIAVSELIGALVQRLPIAMRIRGPSANRIATRLGWGPSVAPALRGIRRGCRLQISLVPGFALSRNLHAHNLACSSPGYTCNGDSAIDRCILCRRVNQSAYLHLLQGFTVR